jgi:NAD(P)H-flavin reductase
MITRVNEYVPNYTEVTESRKETRDVFTIATREKNAGIPGQFFMLSLPGVGEAPISVASGTGRNMEFTIRSIGKVTSKLENEKKIGIRGPYGNGWPWEEYDEILAIAGGIGIPPIRSLIQVIADKGEADKLEVLYGAKLPSDIVYRNEIDDWKRKIRFLLTVDNGDSTWNGRTGFVTSLIRESTVSRNAAAFVIGPPLMMKNSVLELVANGFSEDRIFLSLERRMECGIGVCGHCNLGEFYVCEDGPIFNYSKVKTQPELFL